MTEQPTTISSPEGSGRAATPRLEQARQERKGVRAAFDRLERAAASPASERTAEWCDAFTGRLRELRAAFAHHVELTEADDGLFAEIVATAPRLTHRTDELRHDHRDIEDALDRAEAQLGGVGLPDPKAIVHARDAAVELMGRISRHRHLGAELVYDAYNVDIEAAD